MLQVTTQPVGSTSPNLATQPVVAAKKSRGTTDTSYVTSVVPTLNVLTGSATLGGSEATGKACVAGVCTFTNLTVTAAAGATWTITFTSGTLTSATSSTGTTTGGFTPFAAGFNFRNTLAWATDQTNEVFVGGEAYPHTYTLVGGATRTAGYSTTTSTLQPRDRSTSGGVDRRLNGAIFDSTNAGVFQIDGLVAGGVYDVRLALGDPDNPQTCACTVKDGATTKITVGSTAVPAGSAVDASATIRTDAAWPAGNTAVSVTMAGTSLTVNIPVNAYMQHVSVVRTA